MAKFDIKRLARQKAKRKADATLRPIEITRSLEAELERIVMKIVAAWIKAINETILPAFSSALEFQKLTRDAPSDTIRSALEASQEILDRLVISLGLDVEEWAAKVEEWHRRKFTTSLREALGLDISLNISEFDFDDELQLVVERNVGLIKGLSDDLRKNVEQAVVNAMVQGKPRRELAKELTERVEVSRSRAKLIARDQTTKLASNLDKMRQEQAGIDEYKWRHSGKAHPRPEHVRRDGKIFRWDSPPSDGHPGQAINCGCKAQAYVRL
jgi:SPP1 gp7 family putative phage head morphogenesis protein